MNTETKTDLTVANTIARQIGARAFQMMGTITKLGTANSLIFNLRGSPAGISKIEVTLDPSDTYTVKFWRGACGRHLAKLVHEIDNVYADGLNQCIEHTTGLLLSL